MKPLTPSEALSKAASYCSKGEHCIADKYKNFINGDLKEKKSNTLSANCANRVLSMSNATPKPISTTNTDLPSGGASRLNKAFAKNRFPQQYSSH